jgi:hypothetical protein
MMKMHKCGKQGCNKQVRGYFCEGHEYERYAPVFTRQFAAIQSSTQEDLCE